MIVARKKEVIKKLTDHGSQGDQYLSSKQGGYVIDFYSVATGRSIGFKGFVTNFSDSFQANFNSETVYGRMDPIMTYQNTERSIEMSFDIIAVNIQEAVSNLARIENLITLLYPKYNSGEVQTIQSTPLIKVKFANMIMDNSAVPPLGEPRFDNKGRSISLGSSIVAKDSGLLGAIDNFTYAPDLQNGMFMTNNGRTYPRYVEMSFNMTVLHTHDLGWDEENRWRGDRPGASDGMAYPYGTDSLTGRSNKKKPSVGNLTNTQDSRFDAQKNNSLDKILGDT